MTTLRIVASLRSKPGKRKPLLAALHPHITASREEAGNISFEIYEDPNDENTFVLVEDWQSREAIELHNETPHFKTYRNAAADLLQDSVVKIVRRLEME